jgi:GxxExxY protein
MGCLGWNSGVQCGHRGTEGTEKYMDNMDQLNEITERIIGCAIEVHKCLGPGLLESIYENALCYELKEINLKYERQKQIPIFYKSHNLGEYRLDLLVEDAVIIELKSVDRMDRLFEAQLLSYLKITEKRLGLLINFNVSFLRDGIKRIIL